MSKVEVFVNNLQYYLTKNKCEKCNIIRKHSKKLEQLGDISLPLNIESWHQLINNIQLQKDAQTIFDFENKETDLETHCNKLKNESQHWIIQIKTISVISSNVHIFLNRSSTLYVNVLQEVLDNSTDYATCKCLNKNYVVDTVFDFEKDILDCDLTLLRLKILRDIANKLVDKFSGTSNEYPHCKIVIRLDCKKSNGKDVLCGPILNDKGVKTSITAGELFRYVC